MRLVISATFYKLSSRHDVDSNSNSYEDRLARLISRAYLWCSISKRLYMEESKLIPTEPIPAPTLREDGRGIDWSATFDIIGALPPGASREIPVVTGMKAVDFMTRNEG